jgi:hypothetical protein
MDRIPNPQFNLTLFNHITQITANSKFCLDLVDLIKSDNEFLDEFGDFVDDMIAVQAGTDMAIHDEGDYQICRFKGVRNIFLSPEFAKPFAEYILEKSGNICKMNPGLNMNTFVAFGKKLRCAADNDYESLEKAPPRNRGPIREIVVRRTVR